ncbi:hypothetical protein GCM10022220_66440 [Actinocatenispora rupis]|uniref:DoxX-like family protein n=1 Tax=Actinocatenispora rupis TaxID=519421 RepID=A0A8J3JG91_9ACTN|nr:hypothetical protein Aru02nite_70380 [Actinocatenispora rupis]
MLWTVQILLAAFFAFASAAPKLVGERTAVETFAQIGAGQWFRYVVGVLELAGAIGLLVPRLTGLAAIGLMLLTIGAAATQTFVLAGPASAIFPLVLAVVFALLAWARRDTTAALFRRTHR